MGYDLRDFEKIGCNNFKGLWHSFKSRIWRGHRNLNQDKPRIEITRNASEL